MSPPSPSDQAEEANASPRLTPLPEPASGRAGDAVSLAGTWQFAAAPAREPPGSDADWRTHDVPGLWSEAGYEVDDREVGWYRRSVRVPPSWLDGRVKLRFGAVYSEATVWVNGNPQGDHVGGYTPFEVDVTDAVSPGENTLSVAVSEDSRAAALDWGNVTGGVTRDVTLFAVPDCHLSRFHVETALDADSAVLRTLATVENEGTQTRTPSLRTAFEGPDGETTATRADLDPLAPGESRDVILDTELADPTRWTPATPALYDARCTLSAASADADPVTTCQSVGVRELAVVGDELRLNGTPLTLRGVNWEEVTHDRGSIIDDRLTRADAERLRAANVNYVRPHTYPPTEAFLDACDELGILVQVELPFTFVRGEDAAPAEDPAYRDLMCRAARETIERDRNHPSVAVWSLANESEWGPNFAAVAAAVDAADPTRPTTFNWAEYRDDDAGHCAVGNHHYPEMRTPGSLTARDFEGFDRPMLFDEYAHVYCYNHRELLTDPGLRDRWGAFLDAVWGTVRDVDSAVGAAVFSGVDHVHPEFRWGLLDAFRRERPEYWHVKKVYSPVAATLRERTAEEALVELTNGADFRSLADCRVEWETAAERGDVAADVPPGEAGTVTVPTAGPFTLRVVDPDGFLVDAYRFEDRAAPSLPDAPPSGTVSTEGSSVVVGQDAWTVDAETGRVSAGAIDCVPTPVVTPLEEGRTGDHQRVDPFEGPVDGWTVSGVAVEDGALTIEGAGDGVDARFALTPLADGWVRVAYDLTFTEDRRPREVGFALDLAGRRPTLSWDRGGYWTTYPDDHVGRESGRAAAFPSGERPAGTDRDPSRPWSRDATPRGSNDFRSCKRNVQRASLVGEDGAGVSLRADGETAVRAAVTDDAVRLFVLGRSLAGSGGTWFDRNETLGEDATAAAGTTIRGAVDVTLEN